MHWQTLMTLTATEYPASAALAGSVGGRGLKRVRAQTAQAFALDMGLSTTVLTRQPREIARQRNPPAWPALLHGVEVSDEILESVADYVVNLGPPARDER